MIQGILSITICPEDDMFEKVKVEQSYIDGVYDVNIHTLLDEPFSALIKNENCLRAIEEDMRFSLQFEDFSQCFPFYNYVIDHCRDDNFISSFNIIHINGIYEDIAEYLRRNPELLDKEIVLAEFLDLDMDTCLRLKEVFKDFPNIKLRIDGNNELISLSEYEKTIEAIDSIVEKINRYDYSPLEQLILAYDLIRDRFYVREGEDEDYNVSRDLTSSLLGDKIVCVGFANIFDAVCKKLNIKSNVFLLNNRRDTTTGHARNMVHLQDDKYGIDGIYFFDPTFDCKKDEENNFLFSYRFFAKDYIEMCELSGDKYIPRDFKLFDERFFYALMDKCEELDGDLGTVFKVLNLSRVNTLLKFVDKDTIEPLKPGFNPVEIIDACYDVKVMAEQSIGAETFLRALYTVRKNQYYEEPGKYLFDVQTLTKIITNSRFRADDNAELALLAAMGFTHYYGKNSSEEKVTKFITKNGLDTDIERTKLARTLRTILDTRIEEENKSKKL